MPPRKRLGQLLTELGVIDEHQLQSALGHQKQWGGKLGAILVQKGFCNEDQMVSALTQHLGLARVKLAEAKIDPRAQKCVSRQIAEKLHVFPYELSGSGRSEVVTIAMSDPTDLSAVDQLAFHTGKRIKPMLAGESEVLTAIHAHYGAPEEKKEPTDKLGQQRSAPSTGTFPRRIDSPPAVAPPPRASPYIPPPIPAAKPPARAQDLEEIEPDEVMAPPADTAKPSAPVAVPEAEAESMGLEPIAAHSQPREAIAAGEEVGQGSATDAVEGLVPATTGNVAADEAAWAQGAEAAPAQPESAWGAPAQADAQGWGETGEDVPVDDAGWGAEPEAQPAEVVSEELPADAILEAPGPGDEEGAEDDAREARLSAAGAESRSVEQDEADADTPLPIEDDIDAAEDPAGAGEAAPAAEEAPPEEMAYEADAPDAWASSDDPLAAQGADAPAWGEVPREESADHAAGPDATQEFANPVDAGGEASEPEAEPAAEESPREWGAAEDVPVEEAFSDEPPAEAEARLDAAPPEEPRFDEAPPEEPRFDEAPPEEVQAEESEPQAPEQGEYAPEDEEGDLVEGWVAPPEEREAQGGGWIGEALEASAPLAPSDLEALSSIGLDPNDGVGALRLLAALVRILRRRQLIDPEELAAEIRESRAQGAASAAEPPYEGERGPDDLPVDPGSAET